MRKNLLLFCFFLNLSAVFGQNKLTYEDAENVLFKYAPVVYQECRSDLVCGYQFYKEGDIPVRVDFDGNWSGLDNWENCCPPSVSADFSGAAYTSAIATETHWFLGFFFFHAVDDSVDIIDRHENDLEGVYICVNRQSGIIENILTNAHGSLQKYSKSGINRFYMENGRPAIFITSNGSGFFKGHAIFIFDPAKIKKQKQFFHFIPNPAAGTMPQVNRARSGIVTSAQYQLISLKVIESQLNNRELFSSYTKFTGNTWGEGANPPWANKDLFFDPAKSFKRFFKFCGENYSQNYEYHPYEELNKVINR